MGCIVLVLCVLVLRCGSAGVVWYPDAGFSHTTPPQPNHTVTPTHIVPEQYNPWNNSTNKSQAPEDDCINIQNMLSMKCIQSLPQDTTPPQPNHNVTPTRILPEQYNPWNNSTNKSQAAEDGCFNTWNMLSMK
jgi:hypothetical protein